MYLSEGEGVSPRIVTFDNCSWSCSALGKAQTQTNYLLVGKYMVFKLRT